MMSQTHPQPDLFAEQPSTRQDLSTATLEATLPRVVRPRLANLLGELRSATGNPWTRQRTGVHLLLFHQMSNWLPEIEREDMRAAFHAELVRLGITD